VASPEIGLGDVLKFASSNWASIAGSIAVFYWVVKLGMRNAILEAISQLDKKFVSFGLYNENKEHVADRLDKLEIKKGGK
jgi:hypothetical protein